MRLGALQLVGLQIQNRPSGTCALQVLPISKLATKINRTVPFSLAQISKAVVGQVVDGTEPLAFKFGIIWCEAVLHDEVGEILGLEEMLNFSRREPDAN